MPVCNTAPTSLLPEVNMALPALLIFQPTDVLLTVSDMAVRKLRS
jgi:hypothetical protein